MNTTELDDAMNLIKEEILIDMIKSLSSEPEDSVDGNDTVNYIYQ